MNDLDYICEVVNFHNRAYRGSVVGFVYQTQIPELHLYYKGEYANALLDHTVAAAENPALFMPATMTIEGTYSMYEQNDVDDTQLDKQKVKPLLWYLYSAYDTAAYELGWSGEEMDAIRKHIDELVGPCDKHPDDIKFQELGL